MQSLCLTVLTLSSTSAVLAAVPVYGQCGGSTYTGDKACATGTQCKEFNPWYSQCVPGTAAASPNAPAVVPAASSAAAAAPTTLVTRPASSIVVQPSTASSVAAAAPSKAADVAGSGANGAQCSINEAFKAKGKKYIGVAADQGTLSNAQNSQVIKDNFGQVTPENS